MAAATASNCSRGPGVLRIDDVVEHQPSLVQGVVRAGELDGPTPVPGEEFAEAVALGADGPNGPCWGGSLGHDVASWFAFHRL